MSEQFTVDSVQKRHSTQRLAYSVQNTQHLNAQRCTLYARLRAQPRGRSPRGAGLIEVVVGAGLMAVVFVGLFGLLQFATRLATDTASRAGATALALERVEYIRSLAYSAVGTVGGTPAAALAASESITLNAVPYTRRTHIVYVDDEADGVGAGDTNGITNDYKRVKVEVSWARGELVRNVSIVTDIAPVGVEH